jgi:hypothetical protein
VCFTSFQGNGTLAPSRNFDSLPPRKRERHPLTILLDGAKGPAVSRRDAVKPTARVRVERGN